jgi:hypothetical protein
VKFRVSRDLPTTNVADRAFLLKTSWDDWFRYETRFNLYYVDNEHKLIDIGWVKIGQVGMGHGARIVGDLKPRTIGDGTRIPAVPRTFTQLGGGFFSLGQEAEYYEKLNELAGDKGAELRTALRDVVDDEQLFEAALAEAG